MFLIYERSEYSYTVVMFSSLDDIKLAVENGIYGQEKYDKIMKTNIKNNFNDFKIKSNFEFPLLLCNDLVKE